MSKGPDAGGPGAGDPASADEHPSRGDEEARDARRAELRRRSRSLVWLLAAMALGLWIWSVVGSLNAPAEIPFSTFRQELRAGNVRRVEIRGQRVEGTLRQERPLPRTREASSLPAPSPETGADSADGTATEPPGAPPVEVPGQAGQARREAPGQTPGQTAPERTYTRFVTHIPEFAGEQLLAELESHDVEIVVRPQADTTWVSILVSMAPFLLLLWLGYLFLQRMQSQGQRLFGMRQSRAKPYEKEEEHTTFEDVAGAAGPKQELVEIIGFLREPQRFRRLGGQMPRGILLVGPPGTGKTLMARAIAGEAEVPFFSITGSDFMEMFVGVGASRVRDMFREAKKNAPAIIFIDELDSIGRRRGAGLGGGHDEREQTLNQLLSEMDGFEPNENVVVMAATNRPDILDPALLRPGRFDRRVTVDLPTREERLEILRIHARDKTMADDLDLDELARGTPGFSGADLENLLNEAALLAGREDKDEIEAVDVEAARDKILMGLERQGLLLTDEECRTLAYHEGGHALLACLLPHADPLHKVTIVPRGLAMGVTQQLPERDKYIYQLDYLLDRLAVMMGGRAAEELVLETVTSGAENDLKEATKLARKMVLDWGMSQRFRHVALGDGRQQVFLGEELTQRREHSEATAREIDREVDRILEKAYDRARTTLEERRDTLDRLATALLEQEELSAAEVNELVDAEAS